jgi:protein TonB
MKTVLLCAFILLAGAAMGAGEYKTNFRATADTTPAIISEEDKIFNKVEIEARFPGGDAEWRKFLERNINAGVATKNKAPEGTYTVIVQFVVDREGQVSDVRALTNHGYGMEEEVIRLLRRAPRWEPAVQDGRKVKAYRKQPVTFQVIDDRKKKKKQKDDD